MSSIVRPIVYIDENVTSVQSARFKSDYAEKERNKLKSEIFSLIMSTPKDITPDGEEPKSYISEIYDELWEQLWDVFIDDYKYTIIADDAEFSENSLVVKAWDEKKKELQSIKREEEKRDDFFQRYGHVLNKYNFDDILIYEKWNNGEIVIPCSDEFTQEYREKLLQEIKDKEKEIFKKALKDINNGK